MTSYKCTIQCSGGGTIMHEALFYTIDSDQNTTCSLCSHHCHIKPGKRGLCGVRENQDGKLASLVYGRLVSENSDPIEKKPLFHFLPGSRSYSIATVGCNFHCQHCQNFEISQFPHMHDGQITGRNRTAQAVVDAAVGAQCASISSTYVEPTVFYEFAHDCAMQAHQQQLKNVFVSNGFMTSEVTRHLAPVLDGINIDIKAFSDDFYKKLCKGRLQPVLDTVRLMHELGVWVEVTTLLIPGLNDSPEELRDIARFIKDIDASIPWHVTAFYPTYKLIDRPPTPAETLRSARDIGLEQGLHFVYEGNIPGMGGENTFCPSCGTELITRFGFRIQEDRITGGCCPDCGEKIAGVWS